MFQLVLTNTLGRKKQVFKPLKNNVVSMYVCGITPYDFAHIGHGRCYVTFDVLFRLLNALGYEVKYVRNFTDIDDKLIDKSLKIFGDESSYLKIAEKFEQAFDEDMHALNCITPFLQPKVTENIEEIITFVAQLVDAKKAYVANGSVYFDITKFSDYGKLSGRDITELLSGARVEVNDEKRHPSDFALWKASAENFFWKSPWGWGRPGWHIECSAMAKKYLEPQIDIHGGGMDLIFPHHENEIAQSESLTLCNFANFWIHNAFVNINKEKMSKSLGNFFTLKDIFAKYDPMVLRFYYLQHQYRSPIEFSFDDLSAAERAYRRLIENFSEFSSAKNFDFSNPIILELFNAIADDLNTPKVFGIIFENLNKLFNDLVLTEQLKGFLVNILGLTLYPIKKDEPKVTEEIENLLKEREEARKNKDWKRADEIRDKLLKMGYSIQDKKLN